MSIELSHDASRLIEDIELELASIRAAMALRPLDEKPVPTPAPAAKAADVPVRAIGPFDLTRSGAEPKPAAAAVSSTGAIEQSEPPKRMTLQARLASLRDQG